jgi:hypothetical protein
MARWRIETKAFTMNGRFMTHHALRTGHGKKATIPIAMGMNPPFASPPGNTEAL